MGKLVDRTGHRYGMLEVIERDLSKPSAAEGRRVYWTCRCDCGRTKSITGHELHAGLQSCGCAHYALIGAKRKIHGHVSRGGRRTPTPTYRSWQAAKERCHRPNSAKYASYGGRGIIVCDRWRNSFENFLADMGERPPGKTLDRIDATGYYEPGNCRWATAREQCLNRAVTKWIAWRGQMLTIGDIAQLERIPRTTLGKRYRALGDIHSAVEETKAKLRWPIAA